MKRQVLILASGPLNPSGDTLIFKALAPFVHEVIDKQRIDIAGHTIVAVLILCDPAHIPAILEDLRIAMDPHNFDIALEELESTLIQDEVIDLLAREAGRGSEVKEITDQAMAGKIDFVAALEKRVSFLSGLSISVFQKLAREIRYSDGALELIEFCKEKGIPIGAVSGGFKQAVTALGLPEKLDFIRANELEENDGILTGKLVGKIIDAHAKAEALLDFAALSEIPLAETIAIGDGANDIEMIRAAGLGIAYKAKPALRDAADEEISHSLTELIPLLRNS